MKLMATPCAALVVELLTDALLADALLAPRPEEGVLLSGAGVPALIAVTLTGFKLLSETLAAKNKL